MIWVASTAITVDAMMDSALPAVARIRTVPPCTIWAASAMMTVDTNTDAAMRTRTVTPHIIWAVSAMVTKDANTNSTSPATTIRRTTPHTTLVALR